VPTNFSQGIEDNVNEALSGAKGEIVVKILGPDLPIALPDGTGSIPLSAIARVEVKQGAGRVSREAGARNVAVKANLLGRDQGSFVEEAMHKSARKSNCRRAITSPGVASSRISNVRLRV